MSSFRRLFFEHLAQTSEYPLGLEVEKAKGVYLHTSDGKKIMDLISGISVSNLGHSHPGIVNAVREQAEKNLHLMVYGEYIQSPQVKLAAKLSELLPGDLNSVFFVNSGSEAVEGAVKLAKSFTGRYEIVAFEKAYHGSTHGSISISGSPSYGRKFRPLLPGIFFVRYNSFEQIDQISGKTACVIAEPVQGEAGVILPEKGFLQELRRRCDQTGALLVFDEVQTGFGRTGSLFAMEKYGVEPDIAVFAKGMGGGMPLGAFVSSKRIMSRLSKDPPLGHISTFGGHPVSCAAALASLEYLTRTRIYESAAEKGNLFRELLSHKAIREVRGVGLLLAADLGDAGLVKEVLKLALEKGVVADWFLFNAESVRIAPPLTITEEEIRHAASVLIRSLNEVLKTEPGNGIT